MDKESLILNLLKVIQFFHSYLIHRVSCAIWSGNTTVSKHLFSDLVTPPAGCAVHNKGYWLFCLDLPRVSYSGAHGDLMLPALSSYVRKKLSIHTDNKIQSGMGRLKLSN